MYLFTGPDGAAVSCCETPGNGVGIEDDYLITAQGLERLTLTEQAVL
jgi:hypothetical protein